MHESPFLTDLAMVLGVAGLAAIVLRLLNQPTVLGYLFAGLVVGPSLPIPLFADQSRVAPLAELGVVLVMFAIGLELRVAKLLKMLPTAGLTALVQISVMIWAGFSVGQLLGWSTVESIFLGASIAISSTMVVSKVFAFRPVPDDVRELVFGVLVIQDVAAVVLIAAMSAVAAGGDLSPAELGATLLELAGVLLGLVVVGLLVVSRLARAVVRLRSAELTVVFAVGLAFTYAELAALLGYSVALGAFIAGVAVAESGEGHEVEHAIAPVRDVFAAIFFVSIGMGVNPAAALETLPIALLVAAVVVAAQLGAVSVGAVISGNGLRRAIPAGLALGQVGEFGFIIATIGVGDAHTPGPVKVALGPVLVTAAVITTFTTPLAVRSAGAVVRWVDRAAPRRLQHFLGLYETWLETVRTRRDARLQVPLWRAARGVTLDLVGLLVLLAVTIVWLPAAADWLAAKAGLDAVLARVLVAAAALLVASPMLVGLVRSAVVFVRRAGERVLPGDREPSIAEKVGAHALRVMLTLGLVLGVGVPTMAVLRPLTGGFYGVLVLVIAVGAVAVYLWRQAGRLEDELRTGAERVAELLATAGGADAVAEAEHAAAPAPPEAEQEPPTARRRRDSTAEIPALLPGIADTALVYVGEAAHAAGRTLREVDLRSRVGATVVAIHRKGGAAEVLPSGGTRLEAGDLLALTGTRDAIRDAAALLERGATGSGAAAVAPAT
ncbi:MAG: cation:proton antiporter [Deltaproteobacteria bacterium]|nr:cation:proton antiporter [Deltaproteobacteria bacterium]